MEYRNFGNTDLKISQIGFGAWGIGGPAMAGNIPIGWGDVNDEDSIKALKTAYNLGVNFYDTADFYGLGHSESLIGKTFYKNKDVIIATKVGHKIADDNSIFLDYSKKHILNACENSLRRLKRDYIDLYQLHSAKIEHLEQGECIEAMQTLVKDGKVRYWGISLNTFNPFPEAEFFIKNNIGSSFQVVYNIINQKAKDLIESSSKLGYGIIARMPLQFGILTGKFNKNSIFNQNDHRAFRLTYDILSKCLDGTEAVWELLKKYNTTKTGLSLSFILSSIGIATVIPGIKTEFQAIDNTSGLVCLEPEDMEYINALYTTKFSKIVEDMQKQG
ncbi:MAG: aldo/keto reductase [bacterium]